MQVLPSEITCLVWKQCLVFDSDDRYSTLVAVACCSKRFYDEVQYVFSNFHHHGALSGLTLGALHKLCKVKKKITFGYTRVVCLGMNMRNTDFHSYAPDWSTWRPGSGRVRDLLYYSPLLRCVLYRGEPLKDSLHVVTELKGTPGFFSNPCGIHRDFLRLTYHFSVKKCCIHYQCGWRDLYSTLEEGQSQELIKVCVYDDLLQPFGIDRVKAATAMQWYEALYPGLPIEMQDGGIEPDYHMNGIYRVPVAFLQKVEHCYRPAGSGEGLEKLSKWFMRASQEEVEAIEKVTGLQLLP